ncbi:unnamed protein product [Musa textilis]
MIGSFVNTWRRLMHKIGGNNRMVNSSGPMRLLRISPRIVIVVFVVAASILGVLTHSFLQGGAWIAADQKLGLVVGPLLKGPADPPVFAYWISGTGGEGLKMLRLLKAVYHPRNRYLLHLDAGSSAVERSNLARSVQSERLFRAFRNVDVIGQSYAVDQTGPSVLAATLHGAAVLLRLNADWDWFITLSASDYPLVTQDGESLHLCFMLTTDLVPCRLLLFTSIDLCRIIFAYRDGVVLKPYISLNLTIRDIPQMPPGLLLHDL